MEGWRQLEEEEWHWRHRQRLSVCSSFNDMTTDDLQVAFCSVKSESYLRKYLLYCKSLYWLDYWIDCWCFKRSPEAIYFNRDSFVRSQSYITLSAAASKSKNSNIFSSDRRTRQRSNLRRKGKKETSQRDLKIHSPESELMSQDGRRRIFTWTWKTSAFYAEFNYLFYSLKEGN